MKKSGILIVTVAILVAIGIGPAGAEEAPRLVEYVASSGDGSGAGDTGVGLSPLISETLEAILANPSAVDVRIGEASLDAVRSARTLSLVLPRSTVSGTELIASFDNLEITERSEHDYSVHGVNESPASEVSLAVLGEDVFGTIRYESEVFEVRPLGDGLTAVYRRDTSQWPPGTECGVTGGPPQSPAHGPANAPGIDSGSGAVNAFPPGGEESGAPAGGDEVIDVLVVYTPRARSAAGNIDALIQNFSDDTNRALANSLVRVRMRLVHSEEIQYRQDDDMREDRMRLRTPGDGQIDEVHALRSRHGADLVALLVGSRSNYCGFANIYYGSASGGFSVTAQDCGSGTFAHELGHNLGAHHDPGTDTNRGFPYGHGFCNHRDVWRTIMSYNFEEGCRPRAPYFSNPEVFYRGTRTGDDHTRNNARVFRETAWHISNFRVPLPPAHTVPLVMSADNATQQGFLRIINRSGEGGEVRIDAHDDEGKHFGPVDLSLDAKQTRHFNSTDLENGNTSKGLSRGVGNGNGNWRLDLTTDLDIMTRAYIRTSDGFLTSIHEVAAEEDGGTMRYRVPTFNPGKNVDQESQLRLINLGAAPASIVISGLDDMGDAPDGGSVGLTLPAGAARLVSVNQLEQGASGLSGRFGAGSGKWQLSVSADQPLQVMSLLFSRGTGNLTNLSR